MVGFAPWIHTYAIILPFETRKDPKKILEGIRYTRVLPSDHGIQQGLQQEGLRTLITKVEIGNIASRRAVLKVGFHEAD